MTHQCVAGDLGGTSSTRVIMNIRSIDSSTTSSLRPAAAGRLRGNSATSETLVEQASTIVRLSPVARRLGSDYRDPNLDPLHPRHPRGEAPRENSSSSSARTDEEQSATQAIRRAFLKAGDERLDPRDPTQARPGEDRSARRGQEPEPRRRDHRGAPIGSAATRDLSPADIERIARLQQRDREVRAHEAAHQSAAGGLAGAARYDTAVGPDGRTYAVGGEVPINISSGSSPEETIERMNRVQRAAMAPANPSGQDVSVASRAARMISQARMELARRDAEMKQAPRSNRSTGTEQSEPRVNGHEATGEIGNQTTGASEFDDAIARAPRQTPLAERPKSFMEHVEELAATVKITRRTGGVSGGHLHTSLNCGFCSRGMAAYIANVA